MLEFGDLSESYGLLFLPRMPDLKGFHIEFENDKMDKDSIKFKDKSREKHRIQNLEVIKAKRAIEKLQRKMRWEKETQRKKLLMKLRSQKKRSRTKALQSDWNELDNEIRMMKKLKKKKITLEQFEEAVGERNSDELLL